jgi:hypothetical protein
MSPLMDLKLLAALVCDDWRREDNGKEILLGIYTGGIVVPQIPVALQICLWLYVQPPEPGVAQFDLRILEPSHKEVLQANFQFQVASTEHPMTVPLVRLPFQISQLGTFKFQWKLPGHDWKTVVEKNVSMLPPRTASQVLLS